MREGKGTFYYARYLLHVSKSRIQPIHVQSILSFELLFSVEQCIVVNGSTTRSMAGGSSYSRVEKSMKDFFTLTRWLTSKPRD